MEVLQLSCKNDAREFSCYCSLLGSDLVEVVGGCVELPYKSAVLVSLILSLEMGIFPCFSFMKVQLPETDKCILWQLLSHKVGLISVALQEKNTSYPVRTDQGIFSVSLILLLLACLLCSGSFLLCITSSQAMQVRREY